MEIWPDLNQSLLSQVQIFGQCGCSQACMLRKTFLWHLHECRFPCQANTSIILQDFYPQNCAKLNKLSKILYTKAPQVRMLWRCLQSRIITNKQANFFAQDYFLLLLLEKSGLVTLLADVQMAKFDQNLTKIWSKLWSSPNFHL